MKPFSQLNRWDQPKNPYLRLANLQVQLLYRKKLDKPVVIPMSSVVGNIAILENDTGKFGISGETISCVGLGTLVSFGFCDPYVNLNCLYWMICWIVLGVVAGGWRIGMVTIQNCCVVLSSLVYRLWVSLVNLCSLTMFSYCVVMMTIQLSYYY